MTARSVFRRTAEFFTGLFFAAALYGGYLAWDAWQDSLVQVTSIATFRIMVPDMTIADDPVVIYSGTVKLPFDGNRIVKVLDINQNTVCSGPEKRFATEAIGDFKAAGKTLSWFVGAACPLAPGEYVLEIDYHLTANGLPPKPLTINSNLFNVTEPK